MKVKSVTDVITNSSNETFMVITSMTILRLKELANAALELCYSDTNGLSGEKKLEFDDVFELTLTLVDQAEAAEKWEEVKDNYPDDVDLKECKTLEEFALYYDSRYCSEHPLISGFTVTAKNLKYAKLAVALNHLDCNFYDLREVYC